MIRLKIDLKMKEWTFVLSDKASKMQILWQQLWQAYDTHSFNVNDAQSGFIHNLNHMYNIRARIYR